MNTDLPSRRTSTSLAVIWDEPSGPGRCEMVVTVGYHPATLVPVEVFARAARPGSMIDSLLDEGCMMISHLLQFGFSPASLAPMFGRADDGRPQTVLGAVFDVLGAES